MTKFETHEQRIADLEELCKQLNANIRMLAAIVQAHDAKIDDLRKADSQHTERREKIAALLQD